MERGVRHGCPLAPYLYMYVADVLGHMISDPKHGIQGLLMPDGSELREVIFANNTNLYLQGTKENLQQVYNVLDRFCHA